MRWPRPLAVLDLETTGLDPLTCHLTEVAVVHLDEELREERWLHLRVQVPADAEREAWVKEHTAWGKADPHEWNGTATPLDQALRTLSAWLEDRALVAQYMPFEVSWLDELYRVTQLEASSWIVGCKYRSDSIDTRDLATPLKLQGLIERRGLADLTEYFGIDHDHHDALSDARAAADVLRRLGRWRPPPRVCAGQPSPYSQPYDYEHQLATLSGSP